MKNPHLAIFLFSGVLSLQGCSSTTTFQGECKRDSDCEQYERCDTLDYRCVCADDEACAPGEYCNASGSCQVISACFTNDDCETGSICDVYSDPAECIASNACTQDAHCDIGMICNNGECRLGCRDTADCDLEDRQVCINGFCVQGKCENSLYCDFGRVCITETHECEQPTEPYCYSGCDPICSVCVPGDSPCIDPANICSDSDPIHTYCWVACDPAADTCPSGYQCVPTTFSWAVCNTDLDCAGVRNTCGAASHRCALNQQVCDVSQDCHDFGPAVCLSNYCVIGYHCEPPGGCRP